ncbi:MAG: CoA transferase, partial [Sphingomonadaceae bacterium]|nr:CoA transferase [Sphingomonadaceae bacterium]
VARGTFIEVGGDTQPAPAPRYSKTVTDQPRPEVGPGKDTDAILAELGLDETELAALNAAGALG